MYRAWVVALFALSGCGQVGQLGQPRTPEEARSPEEATPASPTDPGNLATPGTPSNPANPGPMDPGPVEPPPPVCDTSDLPPTRVGATKVKTLLTGRALSAQELDIINGDPTRLPELVRDWIQMPEAREKLFGFFGTSLQQQDFTREELSEQFIQNRINFYEDWDQLMTGNFSQSMARTTMHFIDDGQPFNRIADTQQFQMTTAMMAALAFWDVYFRDDQEDRRYLAEPRIHEVQLVRDREVPRADSFDPQSDDFMVFSIPESEARCEFPQTRGGRNAPYRAFSIMFGRADLHDCDDTDTTPLAQASDFEDWRMVTVRTPREGEDTTSWLDIEQMRGATEIVLNTPRVGFFTSPAFLGNWLTNDSNSFRLNLNQALIVALNRSFEAEDVVIPAFEDALDDEHAVPGTSCYGCHSRLDPMRQFFRHSYTIFNGPQTDDVTKAIPAEFLFAGTRETGQGVEDLGRILANHPQLPRSWVQKLCTYATSHACPEGDDFNAIVERFVSGGLNFEDMAVDLLSSSLVTGNACVQDGTGAEVSIARRRHLCATLEARLDFDEACTFHRRVRDLVPSIPDDTFARAAVEPVIISEDDIFVRSAEEKICEELAKNRIGRDMFPINEPEVSVAAIVERLMDLPPNHPQHDAMEQLLLDHYEEARQFTEDNGGNGFQARREALRSAFMIGCLSPFVVGMGL